MHTTLKFLTSDDERLLMERAEIRRFQRDDRILEEGSHRAALFLIGSGAVRVERAHFGRGVSFARLGPGDLFGEISFLDAAPASATIFADDDEVEVAMVDGPRLDSLLVSVPGFAARFYQSLATTLMRSANIDRWFTKPRGYAGDFFSIELIYRNNAEGEGRLGRFVDRWALGLTAAQAVRRRDPRGRRPLGWGNGEWCGRGRSCPSSLVPRTPWSLVPGPWLAEHATPDNGATSSFLVRPLPLVPPSLIAPATRGRCAHP
jgi:hypothetical protein